MRTSSLTMSLDCRRQLGWTPDTEALLRRVIEIIEATPGPCRCRRRSSWTTRTRSSSCSTRPAPAARGDRQARWLLKERDEYLAKMQREGDDILQAARLQAERMVQRTEIVREAQPTARRLVEDGRDEARRLRLEAEDYCDQKLAAFEMVLERTIKTVAAGREKLSVTPPPVRRRPRHRHRRHRAGRHPGRARTPSSTRTGPSGPRRRPGWRPSLTADPWPVARHHPAPPARRPAREERRVPGAIGGAAVGRQRGRRPGPRRSADARARLGRRRHRGRGRGPAPRGQGECRRCLRPLAGELRARSASCTGPRGPRNPTPTRTPIPSRATTSTCGRWSRDALLLELPLAPLCREDCPGCARPAAPTSTRAVRVRPVADPRWAAWTPAAPARAGVRRWRPMRAAGPTPILDSSPGRVSLGCPRTAATAPDRKRSPDHGRPQEEDLQGQEPQPAGQRLELDRPARSVCPQCHNAKLPHVVCPNCGWYKGRQAIDVG